MFNDMYFHEEDEEEVDLKKSMDEESENNVKEREQGSKIKIETVNEEKIHLNNSLKDDKLLSDINDNSIKNLIDNE